MKKTKINKYVLGVMVTSRTVHAVLLEAGASEPAVLQHFMRQRNAQAAGAQPSMAAAMPMVEENTSSEDFSIQFGGGSGANDLFLQSEFGGALDGGELGGEDGGAGPVSTFEAELLSILEECREAGYPDPTMAFCAGTADVTHVELRVLDQQKKQKEVKAEDKRGAGAPAAARQERRISRDKLIEHLSEQHQGKFDPERVAFLPMTWTDEGVRRFLAVIMKPKDPVSATLRLLRKQKGQQMPPVRLLDVEASLFLGLARAVLPGGGGAGDGKEKGTAREVQNTLIVRAGADNTLVMFMQGGELLHYESMRSLTAFDAPETICSRVLLHQDENGIDDVHHVLILSEEQEDALVKSFETFFPGAAVKAMRQYLGKLGGGVSAGLNAAALVPALGVALRLVEPPAYRNAFEDVNLLPKQLLRRSIQLPYSWHVLVLGVLLFCTALFFTARFVTIEREIRDYREKLRQFPPVLAETNPQVLQARIDSLQNVHDGYLHALGVLDTLLTGSDQWSRALERTARETVAVTGIWVEKWRPQNARIQISGNATSRSRVVEFAERTGGSIETLTFSEIREWPVYSFNMQIPLTRDLPEAAKYLRSRADTTVTPSDAGGEGRPLAPASLDARP